MEKMTLQQQKDLFGQILPEWGNIRRFFDENDYKLPTDTNSYNWHLRLEAVRQQLTVMFTVWQMEGFDFRFFQECLEFYGVPYEDEEERRSY